MSDKDKLDMSLDEIIKLGQAKAKQEKQAQAAHVDPSHSVGDSTAAARDSSGRFRKQSTTSQSRTHNHSRSQQSITRARDRLNRSLQTRRQQTRDLVRNRRRGFHEKSSTAGTSSQSNAVTSSSSQQREGRQSVKSRLNTMHADKVEEAKVKEGLARDRSIRRRGLSSSDSNLNTDSPKISDLRVRVESSEGTSGSRTTGQRKQNVKRRIQRQKDRARATAARDASQETTRRQRQRISHPADSPKVSDLKIKVEPFKYANESRITGQRKQNIKRRLQRQKERALASAAGVISQQTIARQQRKQRQLMRDAPIRRQTAVDRNHSTGSLRIKVNNASASVERSKSTSVANRILTRTLHQPKSNWSRRSSGYGRCSEVEHTDRVEPAGDLKLSASIIHSSQKRGSRLRADDDIKPQARRRQRSNERRLRLSGDQRSRSHDPPVSHLRKVVW